MSLDGESLAAILLKAAETGAALVAAGSALFLLTFRAEAEALGLARAVRRLAAGAALAALLLLGARFGLDAARLGGEGWASATDAMLLGIVADGPRGEAALWRGLGLAALVPLAVGASPVLGAAALAVAASFALVGHAAGAPGWVPSALVAAHVLAAAFWIGALWPLRAAARPEGAALLARFGRLAAWGVGALVLAGLGLIRAFAGSVEALLASPWAWVLAGKLVVVAGLLALAARNKLKLVPALEAGEAGAAARLRRSITLEMVAVVAILLATAALTTVVSPPG